MGKCCTVIILLYVQPCVCVCWCVETKLCVSTGVAKFVYLYILICEASMTDMTEMITGQNKASLYGMLCECVTVHPEQI